MKHKSYWLGVVALIIGLLFCSKPIFAEEAVEEQIQAEALSEPVSDVWGNLTWSLDTDGVLTVSGNGTMSSLSSYSYYPWYEYREHVTKVVFQEGVKSVGEFAFTNSYPSLTQVEFPTSMSFANKTVFTGNANLKTVVFKGKFTKVPAYACLNMENLTTVIYDLDPGTSITEIGDSAFAGCRSLTAYPVPETVTKINNSAFSRCSSVENFALPASVSEIGGTVFEDNDSLTTAVFTSNLNKIGSGVFKNCDNLFTVTLCDDISSGNQVLAMSNVKTLNIKPEVENIPAYFCCNDYSLETVVGFDSGTLKGILKYAFYNCSLLKEFPVCDSVETIGTYAFYNCSLPKEVSLKNVTSLGSRAFCECTSLETVTGYDTGGITSIPDYAFYDCTSLKSFPLYPSIESIGDYAFYKCSTPTELSLSGVKTVGKYAFYQCSNLQTMKYPVSLVSAGENAFSGCNSITKVIFEKGFTSIPDSVCQGMKNLTEVVFEVEEELAVGLVTPEEVADIRITTIGENAFYGCQKANIVIPDTVTVIKAGAFCDCDQLTSVSLENLTQIGDNAFSYCNGLTSVTVPSGLIKKFGTGVFHNCVYLETITFDYGISSIPKGICSGNTRLKEIILGKNDSGESVKALSIGDDAFRECSSLTALPEGAAVNTVGTYAFYKCSKLKHIEFTDNCTWMKEWSFASCSSLESPDFPELLSRIDQYAFYGCSSFTTICLPANVYTMGMHAFDLCTKVPSIDLSKTRVTIIPEWTFSGCKGLKRVLLPEGLTKIKTGAFNDCPNLNYVPLPASLQTMETRAFSNDVKLSEISIPENLKIVSGPEGPFSGCSGLKNITFEGKRYIIPEYLFANCTGLETVWLPDSVLAINNYAFYGCSSLRQIMLPSRLNEIGDYAFANCSNLQKIKLENCEQIGKSAFVSCTSLSEAVFGDKLINIGSQAFYNCDLTTVILPNSVFNIDSSAFAENQNLTSITIPGNVKRLSNVINNYPATIIGDKETEAETFAKKNGYQFEEGNKATDVSIDDSEDLLLGLGERKYLTVFVQPSNCVSGVKWSLENDNVATLSSVDGMSYKICITGKTEGETTLTVLCGDYTHSWNVKAERRPTQVNFQAENYYLDSLEQTVSLTYYAIPAGISLQEPIFTSSDPFIAEVDENGVVTPKAGGVVRIQLKDGVTGVFDYCFVHVRVPEVLQSLAFDKKELYVTKDPILLSVTTSPKRYSRSNFTYAVEPEGVLSLSQTAEGLLVSAIDEGTATVTVTDKKGTWSDQCIIHADPDKKEVTRIALNKTYVNTSHIGESFTLEASVEPANAISSEVIWTSSDPTVAFVDKSGIVTPLRGGDVMIYASSKSSGLSAGCRVVVNCPVRKITLSKDELTLAEGQEYRLDAVIYPYVCSDATLEWSVSDPDIATVDQFGIVTGTEEGITSVECRSRDGSDVSAVCLVTVTSGQNTVSENTTESYQLALDEYGKDQQAYQNRCDDVQSGKPVTLLSVDEDTEEIITLPKPIEELIKDPKTEDHPQGKNPKTTKSEEKNQTDIDAGQVTGSDQKQASEVKQPVVISQEDPNSEESTKIGTCKLKKVKKQKSKLKLTWKKVENVDGYEIRYAENKKLKKSKKVTVKGQKTKVSIAKAKGKTIYVKIRAYKTVSGVKIYGAWSKVKKAAGK